ncbi:YraN family protein [Phycicoccus duodecadis]|nr:YraN family protein [Phycicoccus duodecadis]
MDTGATDTAGAPPRMRLGRYGEEVAARYLRDQGLEVVERNWRCEHGEVDVVARDGDCLVVCEVKTRRGTGFGDPVEAVTVAKAMRLRRLAAAYVRAHDLHPAQMRVDVIGVLCRPGRPVTLRHVVGVGS